MNHETELKFVGPADALQQLAVSEEFRRMAEHGRIVTATLQGIYYDTEDHRLQAEGFVLRVRNEGKGYVQTVKSNDRHDIATRLELKARLKTAEPQLEAIPDSHVRWRIMEMLDGMPLRPVFATNITRRKVILVPQPGTEIEAAIDEGMISIPEQMAPGGGIAASVSISELELELLKGNAQDLFECARTLTLKLPLTLSLQSKAERGFALARGLVQSPVFSAPIRLQQRTTAEEALRVQIIHSLTQLLGNWTAVVRARDPEGVHQMRVALRRLRSILSIFDEPFRPVLHALEEEVRWIAGVLGEARDLDVFERSILAPVEDSAEDDPGLGALHDVIRSRRHAAWEQLLESLAGQRFRALMLDLAAVTYSRPWFASDGKDSVQRAERFAVPRLKRRWRKIRKAGKRITRLNAQERHALRIRLKKLRYSIDLFGSLFARQDVRGFLKHLSRLQDVLGEMNDATVARSLVHRIIEAHRGDPREAAIAFAGGVVTGWHIARTRRRKRLLRKRWEKVSDLKPFWS